MNNELTYGATRARLLESGYTPVSAISPLEKRTYRVADDLAAVLCLPDIRERRVVSLIVLARDKALRAKIASIVETHGLARGPVRIDSAGNEHRPLRFEDYDVPLNRSWSPYGAPPGEDPAVILESADSLGLGQGLISATIRLDGTWRGGSLLDTPRAKLPAIDRDGIARFFADLSAIPSAEPWVSPPVQPDPAPSHGELNRPRFAALRSKRDLSGNPSVLRAHMEAVARGETEELPDNPPEETEAAAAALAPPSLLSRVLGRG